MVRTCAAIAASFFFVAGCKNRGGNQLAHAAEVVLIKAARGSGGGPDTNAAGHEGRTRFVGNGVLIHGDTNALKKLLGVFTRDIGRGQVHQAQMIVRTAKNQAKPAGGKAFRHGGAIRDHVVDVGFEFRLQRFAESNRLTCNHMHERTALASRKHRFVDLFGDLLVIAQNKAAAWTAKGLVRGGSGDVRIRNGT